VVLHGLMSHWHCSTFAGLNGQLTNKVQIAALHKMQYQAVSSPACVAEQGIGLIRGTCGLRMSRTAA
jgi:hypothetical protein